MHIEDALVLLRHVTGIGSPNLSQYMGVDDPREWLSIIESAEKCLEFLEYTPEGFVDVQDRRQFVKSSIWELVDGDGNKI